MTRQNTRTQPTPTEGLTNGPPAEGAAPREETEAPPEGFADMREAADFLMEDADAVARILVAAGVPLVGAGGDVRVARGDLRRYRERDRAARRQGLRALTRLSIAMGLDDVDYSSLYADPD